MDIEVIRRICLARYLYELASASLRSSNDMHLFAGVNLLQDAVEAFLLAVAEQVAAAIDPNTRFDKYFTEIDAKIAPKTLPFRLKLIRLNRIRVDSKHHGIQPARDECERLMVSVREFFDEVTNSIWSASFSTISTLDLLPDGEVKAVLLEAKSALEANDNRTVAINCRKVLYLEVERKYSVYQFRRGAPRGTLASLFNFSLAPFYAQNEEYIEKHVRDPTDYIVLDHSRVDQDLLSAGIAPHDFWNIWRLTPETFREDDGTWIHREDYDKLDLDLLVDRAEYIFATTVDLALTFHSNRQQIRGQGYAPSKLTLSREQVPVYAKADRGSDVEGQTPNGVTEVNTDYCVPGLKSDGHYWHVRIPSETQYVVGYVHESDVNLDSGGTS